MRSVLLAAVMCLVQALVENACSAQTAAPAVQRFGRFPSLHSNGPSTSASTYRTPHNLGMQSAPRPAQIYYGSSMQQPQRPSQTTGIRRLPPSQTGIRPGTHQVKADTASRPVGSTATPQKQQSTPSPQTASVAGLPKEIIQAPSPTQVDQNGAAAKPSQVPVADNSQPASQQAADQEPVLDAAGYYLDPQVRRFWRDLQGPNRSAWNQSQSAVTSYFQNRWSQSRDHLTTGGQNRFNQRLTNTSHHNQSTFNMHHQAYSLHNIQSRSRE